MSDTTGMFVLTNLRTEIGQLNERLRKVEAERDLYAAQLQGQQKAPETAPLYFMVGKDKFVAWT